MRTVKRRVVKRRPSARRRKPTIRFKKSKSKQSRQPRRKIIRTKIRIKTSSKKRISSQKQLNALAAGRKKLKQMREGRWINGKFRRFTKRKCKT